MVARRFARVVLLVFLFAGVSLRPADGESPAADLIYSRVQIPGGGSAHQLEVDLLSAELRVLDSRDHKRKAMTAREFAEATGAAAVLNGPFFDLDGSPMGLLVVDGKQRQKVRRADWGVFYVDGAGAHVVHTRDYGGGAGTRQAFQVGPRLVVEGEVLALKPQSARRTAVCSKSSGKVVALVTETSVEASVLARYLADIGCKDALNLDGGPSSQIFVSSGGVQHEEEGGTGIPVALGVFPKRPAEERSSRGGGCR
jgi:hypothetical protein